VIIIGCGQLGSRHSQSIAKHPGVTKIVLVDPSNHSLDTAVERIHTTGFEGSIETYNSIENDLGDFSLAIVSTSAGERAEALSSLMLHTSPDHVLLEKLLSPNLIGLNEIERLTQGSNVQFWVNCPMPFFDHYQQIALELNETSGQEPISYTIVGSDFGLVTNFIHYLDHFHNLTGSAVATVTIEPNAILIPSKRNGYSELVGTITAETEYGDKLSVEFLNDRPQDVLIVDIQKGSLSWNVDELGLTLKKRGVDGHIAESHITTPMQSELTHLSLTNLENGLAPAWSTLGTSLELHKKLHQGLANYLGCNSTVVFT
jgi:predicted dehydrogenase